VNSREKKRVATAEAVQWIRKREVAPCPLKNGPGLDEALGDQVAIAYDALGGLDLIGRWARHAGAAGPSAEIQRAFWAIARVAIWFALEQRTWEIPPKEEQ